MWLEIDGGLAKAQPDSLNWDPPSTLAHDGVLAPVFSPHWACRLGFSKLTLVQYALWHEIRDGTLHNISLPHPATGELTTYSCYVESITPRLDTRNTCVAAASGVDILLSRIIVT
jgi:hypothetical protein